MRSDDWFRARAIPRAEVSMLLDLPDLRQQTDYDCGACAVDVIARFHGLRARGPAKLANAVQGMAPDTVAAVLRSLGLRVLAGPLVGGIADLQHYTRAGLPVLCPITADAGGHWVAVRGVERRRVHYHCPTNGPRTMGLQTWLDGWRDTSASGHDFDRWGIVAAR